MLLALIDKGMTRDQAYRIVQGHAMTAWDKGQSLEELMAADPALELTEEELTACFSLERVGDSSEIVFERLADLKL
jgi:adenylosuccinate lyase